MTKRIIAFLMCTVMIFSSLPYSPLAEYFDFALSAMAAEEDFEVNFDGITVLVNSEGVLVPAATFNGADVSDSVTFEWSSRDTSIATVDQNGKVKGIKAGKVTIRLSASYTRGEKTYSGNCNSTVEVVDFIPVENLTAEDAESFSIMEKEGKRLTVNILPATATVKELRWSSSNENIVRITSSGSDDVRSRGFADILGVSEGTATVTCTATDGTNESVTFTVKVQPLIKSLSLPNFVVLKTSSTGQIINYKISPDNVPDKYKLPEWFVDAGGEGVCKVSALGVVEPINPGYCYITAKTKDGSNIMKKTFVVVTDGTKSIALDRSSFSMKVGDKDVNLTAECYMNCGMYYEDAVTWKSSNTDVVTVDDVGNVKAVGPGSARIIVTPADGSNLKDECVVTVTQPVNGVYLPENQVCWKGKTLQLTPGFIPANASDKKVTWTSSDPDVATVSEGLVTGKSIGVTTITVKTNDGGFVAHCLVSVEEPPTSVKLSSSALSLKVGSGTPESFDLIATVEPSTATNKRVIWTSSNEKVATVDANGRVTAVAGGTAVIICTTESAGVKASCNVTVNEYATSISIENVPDSLYKGQRYQLKIKFNSPTVTNKEIIWETTNPTSIQVDKNGLLTAINEDSGSKIIAKYVRSDGTVISVDCDILVGSKIDVTDVSIDNGDKIYERFDRAVQLYATVSPYNASEKGITWSLENNGGGVAAIDANTGLVTPKKAGVVKATVKSKDIGNKSDSCYIYFLSPVEFYSSSTKLAVGTSAPLSFIPNGNPSGIPMTWLSSDETVATVDKNGVVKGIRAGSVTITVTAPDNLFSASCKVNVVIPVTGVKINAKSVTVPKGEKRSVTASVYPANATDQNVTWSTPSQNFSIIEVNSTGQIEGKRVGSTTLTVTTNDGRYTDTINVDVIQPVTEVEFEYSSITLDAGKKKTLTPQIRPISATDKTVKWSSSNTKIATVDSKGVITAVSAGTANITCASSDGYAKSAVKVTVTQPPTGIKFNAKKVTVKIGTPRKLNPTVLPETASNKNVVFSSSDEKIVKVAADGTLTGIKKGTAKVTVTTANSLYSATIKVIVEKPVKKVTLNKTSITIAVGKTTVITPKISPKSASNTQVKWKSSDNDVVSVKNGKITAKAPGYAVVTCTSVDGGKTAECTIFVNQPVKSVKLNKSKLILDVDQKVTLKASIKPSNASNKAVKWTSSDKKVVKVTSKGVLKPVSTGTATVTVSTVDGGFKKTCKVTVVKRVKSVTLPKALTVYLGEKGELDAILNPSKPSNPDVTWKSSKKSVASVSKKGVITPKKTGTAKITVITDDGGLKATCKVSVKRKLKSFTLNKKKITLNAGATFALKVNRKPSNATEGISYITSNKNVATVNSKGVITATGRGTATVTAVSERGISVKCKVTVNQPVNSMYISRTSAAVYMGESLSLVANVLPKNANNQSFTWSTSDASVITVNAGTVTPKKVGTAVITVRSANGKAASCTVTVKQHVNGISLDKTAASLESGETVTLKVTVSPANATEKGYTFSSSDAGIAAVSASGVITAKAPGTATITVKSKENNKTATCKVTVVERVKSVSVSTTAETLYVDKNYVGETLQLTATVFPANATNKKYTWVSSDSSVATVSADGLVTAVKSGVALITVTTDDGKKTASCAVTVLQNVTGITMGHTALTVNKGESVLMDVVIEPADAFNKNIVWSYGWGDIVSVDNYGWLTGLTVGKTTVKATTVDGEFSTSCLVTVNEPVTGIELDKTEITSLYRDETVTLTPTVYPDKLPEYMEEYIDRGVIWTSSDESIARVENGTVTAVGPGEVTITATTVDGGFRAECKVVCFMPVDEIVTEADDFYIKLGEEYAQKIDAKVIPENASFPELTWTAVLPGEQHFTCENGVITGLSIGSGQVIIGSVDNPDVTKTVNIHIVKKVESVNLDKTEVILNKGEASTLTPTVLPSDAHNKNVSYASSDESVVTVTPDGTVTAVGRGTATVTVTTEDEGKTAECVFTVKQLVEEITFPESEYYVGVGKEINLNVLVLPENANDKTLKWESSDLSVATVANGIVTGVSAAEAVITATATDTGEVTKSVKVIVSRHAEKIELTADTDTLWVGDSAVISANVLPEETTDKTVTYTSSDESIATVDSEGKITAVSAGETGTATVVITAVSACGSAENEYTFTVRQQITAIEIPEDEVVIELGNIYTFEPVVLPENAFDKTITYISSDENIITVDNGTVTAAGTGTATVTLVSASGLEKQCSFRVIVLPEKIDMEEEISVARGKTYELKPVLSPDNVTEAKLTYTSSDDMVATVDENGVVTARTAGTAFIRVQSETDNVFAVCAVTVYVGSEKIELTAENYELYIGEEFTLGVTVLPEDTTDKAVTFTSSDEDIITVDDEGNVRAIAKGTAKVTVTAEDTGITSVCEVTVRKHVESISMAEDALVYVGREFGFTAEVLPADADNKNIIWKVSDTRTASIDADGVLTAHESGFVLVTAETEDGGFKAVCFVEIRTGIDSVSLNKKTLLLDRGATEALTFSVLPANADDKKVIWTSSDETVASVDSKGNVTATEKSGTAIIRATAIDNPDAYAECTVTVKIPLETIYLQETSLNMRKGETKEIVVIYRPENATVKDVVFESDDSETVSVDENGVITAHKAGEVNITVTSREKGIAPVTVRVKVYREIESFESYPLVMSKGTQKRCMIAAIPDNHDETLIFSSDNEAVAVVDENGMVTAKSAGTANITVRGSISGESKSHIFTVTVKERVIGVKFGNDSITAVKNDYPLVPYQILFEDEDIFADANNYNGSDIESIEFTSSDEEIAKIINQKDGTVQCLQVGTVKITVTVRTIDSVFTDSYNLTVTEAVYG